MRTTPVRWATVTVAALCVAACGATTPSSAGDPATVATSATSGAATAEPVGLVAIGHSALTGENSDPDHPGLTAFENSWATGRNPKVDSVYQRMLARWPETEAHVANTAVGGATADLLPTQAEEALDQIPEPRLVIVETIDNDIRCDGTDAAHVADFGKSVDAALTIVTGRSPRSRILIVSQPGRPAADIAAMTAGPGRAAFVEHTTGPAPCGFYDDTGRPQPENVAALTAIIEAYEAEQARVCAKYPACSTDEGALHTFVAGPRGMSSDLNHLNVAGLSALARAVWPSAEAAMS